MQVFSSIDDIEAAVGTSLGASEWVALAQPEVDVFAELTGDGQWIHVDPTRAADSSFGGTIVHGFLTLSMLPGFGSQLYRVDAGSARLNYGVEKVRFPAPLRTGTRIRGLATFKEVTRVPSGTQVHTSWTVEAEGSDRPVCVAETITLIVP